MCVWIKNISNRMDISNFTVYPYIYSVEKKSFLLLMYITVRKKKEVLEG